jgi:quinol monooxygenase YgiN
LTDHAAFAGNVVTDVLVERGRRTHWVIYEVWESVAHDEAQPRVPRLGEGKIVDLPPLLAAPRRSRRR